DTLSDVQYQTLLTTNLFSPNLLQDTLQKNPEILGMLLKLIESGIAYYIEEENILPPVSFFLKINGYLASFMESLPSKSPIRIRFEDSVLKIDKRIDDYLTQNNPSIRKFVSETQKVNAIILQRKLYY